MNKLELENRVFDQARERLTSLYGDFDKLLEQTDRPDAAIRVVRNPQVLIGVEITSADKKEVKQYFNDEKHSIVEMQEQIEKCIGGVSPERPFKKTSISFEYDYIFRSIISKSMRFNSYNEDGKYKEIILLVTSDYLSSTYSHFYDYILPWTNYLLSSAKFPFGKVLFICNETSKGIVIYNKKKKCSKKPNREIYKESGVTPLSTGFVPIGGSVSFSNMFKREPIIEMKNNRKKRKGRKL